MSDGDVTFGLAGYLGAMAFGALIGALLVLVRGGQTAAPQDRRTGFEGRPVARWSDEPTELDGPPPGLVFPDRPRIPGR